MNLAQIRAAVQANLRRLKISDLERDDLTRFVNQVVREDICADHAWSFMEATVEINTVASTALYAFPFPDTFKDCEWIGLRVDATSELKELEEDDEVTIVFDRCNLSSGEPVSWARAGKAFRLQPPPDVSTYTLQLKVIKYPDELVADEDTNDLLTYWSKLVEYGVTARACLYWGESPTDAQVWTGFYRDELGKAVSVDRRAQAAANRTLGIAHGAGRRAEKRRVGVSRWRTI